MDINFTAIPNQSQENLLLIRKLYQEKIKDNALIIISRIEKDLSIDLPMVKTIICSLDPKLKFSSNIHFFTVLLESGYAQSDKKKIINSFNHLINLGKDNYYHKDEIIVDTVGTDNYDCGIEELLLQQDYNNGIVNEYGCKPKIEQLNEKKIEFYVPKVFDALNKIADIDEKFFYEVSTYISKIKLFQGRVVTGISGILVFGTIYLRIPKKYDDWLVYFVEHFTHETSHYHLHTLMGFDKMVLNKNQELFPAPIRKDNRPMYGIFHATFVLSRIVRLLSKLNIKYQNKYLKELDNSIKQFKQGFKVVERYAELTNNGKLFLKTFEETANI